MRRFVVPLLLLASCGGLSEEDEKKARAILDKNIDGFKSCLKVRAASDQALLDAETAQEERNFAQAKVLRRKSKDLAERFDAEYERWVGKVKSQMTEAGIPVDGNTIETWRVENGWEQ